MFYCNASLFTVLFTLSLGATKVQSHFGQESQRMVTQQKTTTVPPHSCCPASPQSWIQRSLLLSLGIWNNLVIVKLWSQRIVSCWSVQADAGTGICSLSSRTLLRIQGLQGRNKTALYAGLSRCYLSFWWKYWFIPNYLSCWLSLVHLRFWGYLSTPLKEQVTRERYQSCYWILKSVKSFRVALKKFYRIPQILLCISILYKNGDSNTTEAYIFTHYHLKTGQITLITSGRTSQQKLSFGEGGSNYKFYGSIPVETEVKNLSIFLTSLLARENTLNEYSDRIPAISTAASTALRGEQWTSLPQLSQGTSGMSLLLKLETPSVTKLLYNWGTFKTPFQKIS